MRSTRSLTVALLACSVALAACGSDSGSDSDSADGDDPTVAATAPAGGDNQEAVDQAESDDASGDSGGDVTFGSGGGGTVTVAGVAYTFEADICFYQDSGYEISGPGVDPDGLPAWVSVGGSNDTDYDGDGTPDEEISVSVRVGATSLGESAPDDQPSFSASNVSGISGEEITFERTDNSVSGSGTMTDNNYVAANFNEPVPFEFQAGCD